MHEKYYDQGFRILAFPCNQFGKQEPDPVEKVLEITAAKYGRTFPLFEKIDVKGADADPLYKEFLNPNGDEITWNFHKYLCDHEGNIAKASKGIGLFSGKVSPLSMEKDIQELLSKSSTSHM